MWNTKDELKKQNDTTLGQRPSPGTQKIGYICYLYLLMDFISWVVNNSEKTDRQTDRQKERENIAQQCIVLWQSQLQISGGLNKITRVGLQGVDFGYRMFRTLGLLHTL